MREDTKHRAAFNLYWELGPRRSIEALHRALAADPAAHGFEVAPDLRTLYRWSSALSWQARLAALEREARTRDREAQIAAIDEMNARQAREALLLQQKVIEGLQARAPTDFTPDGLVRALWTAVKVERLARGEPTERSETVEGGDPRLERLSDAQLEQLVRALERPDAAGRLDGLEPPPS